jgi:ABC-type transporter Mla subunit MlaD
MAGRPTSKNNVIAGAFLVVSLVLAIAVSVVISGAQERLIPSKEYLVRFTLADGAAGLKPGSKVSLGGLNVGRVTDLSIVQTPGEPLLEARIRVRTSVTLFENAMVFLERPLLGSGSEINITSVGGHAEGTGFAGASDALEPGEAVAGRLAPPTFLAQAGFGPHQAEKVRIVIDQIAELASRLDGMVEGLEPDVQPAIQSVRAAADDVGAITSDLRERMPGWTERVSTILDDAGEAAAQAGPLVDDARGVVAGVQEAIDVNRPRVDALIASAESAAAKVDTQTVERLNLALNDARVNLELAGKVIGEASAYLSEQMPSVRRMIANFRLASDQLKLVTVEVRRNPWRLLYRPDTRELESELLYDAARSYAEAVSDLRAASESLEAAASGGDPSLTVVERQSIESLHREIMQAFEKYQEAERAFLQRAVDQSE